MCYTLTATTCIAILAICCSLAEQTLPWTKEQTALLAKSYLRYLVAKHAFGQAESLSSKNSNTDIANQISASANKWYQREIVDIRADLTVALGEQAPDQFKTFIARFTEAEEREDSVFLKLIGDSLGLAPSPENYLALRSAAAESLLRSSMDNASEFLTDIQTWLDLAVRRQNPPPLDLWLARNQAETPRSPSERAARPVITKRANPLAEAEADPPKRGSVSDDSMGTPLESLASARQDRRDAALADAKAGMEQIAAERRAAEEDAAEKKLARAEAEAEAMKKQAEKLAAAEKEAMEQRRNSWGQRIKGVVCATISAATGAFTGGLGARAADEALNAIFK